MFCVEKAILPKPQQITSSGKEICIGKLCAPTVELRILSDRSIVFQEAEAFLKKSLAEHFCYYHIPNTPGSFRITLCIDATAPSFSNIEAPEAYCIDITEKEAFLCGKDAAGAFYAVVTFSQMMHTEGDRALLPICKVVDYPDFLHRGNYIECRYGTEFMTKEDWFRAVDYFAMQKNNILNIAIYGCWSNQYDGVLSQYLYLPLQCYPFLKTPKSIRYYSVKQKKWIHRENLLPKIFEEDFFKEIVAYGAKKNITVYPQFNSLGHNNLLPSQIPEISAKEENGTPTGDGFCTRNEKTYEVLFNIYNEIIERYLRPNGIKHIAIGLDEVSTKSICHCPKCHGAEHKELMIEHIIRLCKFLKLQGMKKIYVYHDMLYNTFDCVNEELKQRFVKEGIYDEVVLRWWTYEDPAHLFWDKANGVNNIMHSVIKAYTGYYHWNLPTDSNDNIRACARFAKEHGFEGMEAYSSFEDCYDKNYFCIAEAAWNVEASQDKEGFDTRYAHLRFPSSPEKAKQALEAMRDIMIDETKECYMNRACWRLEYYFYCYRKGNPPSLSPFPKAVFDQHIDQSKGYYRTYLRRIRKNAKAALRFLESESLDVGFYNDVWLLVAKHYYTLANEYLTLWRLRDGCAAGKISSQEILSSLSLLIQQREKLMNLIENVRFPATQYTYLRNMSVFRQFYLELWEHVKNGGAFALAREESKIFSFLR